MSKPMLLFCEPCSYKQIIDDKADLTDMPTAPVQKHIPVLDPKTNKTVPSKFEPQKRKVKCPKCGRGVYLKSLPPSYTSVIKKRADEEEAKRLIEERKKRIEDGLPIQKPRDVDFTG